MGKSIAYFRWGKSWWKSQEFLREWREKAENALDERERRRRWETAKLTADKTANYSKRG